MSEHPGAAGQIQLLRPEWLGALAAAALVLALGWLALRARRRALERLAGARPVARLVPGYSLLRSRLRLALSAAATALLALSLAGPVLGWAARTVQRRGLDLVVCLDTSRSMLVRDLRPDRLTRAKREIVGLLEALSGDRVALVAFSGDVREIAPLTDDRTTLEALLEGLSPADNEKGGTDIGVALQRALALFDGRTGAHEAIVLVTDGEDLEGRGLEVARTAAERGIRVYVVGMATPEGGKIPVRRADGGEGFATDAAGAEVVSALGGESLELIARTTGGEYLAARAAATPLEELYEKRISRLEGVERAGGERWVPHDRYQWPLAAALACLLIEAGLRGRARPRRAARIAAARSSAGAAKEVAA